MERAEGTRAGGQDPTQEGAEGSKEEMVPELELKVKTADGEWQQEMICRVGNTPSTKGRRGKDHGDPLTWETEDGRGYPEGIHTLGQEGEEAEEEQAGCDHQEGQHCPVLSVQDDLWGQEQSGQSNQRLVRAVVTLSHSAAFSKSLLHPREIIPQP